MSSVHQRISAVTTNFNFSVCLSSPGVPGERPGEAPVPPARASARSLFYLSLLVIISKPDFYHTFVWGVFKARGWLPREAGPGPVDFQLPSLPATRGTPPPPPAAPQDAHRSLFGLPPPTPTTHG